MSSATTPSVGRILHYIPGYGEHLNWEDQSQPLPCQIIKVHRNQMVDVAVTDQEAKIHLRKEIPIINDSNDPVPSHGYCQWMPYQKAVAAGETAAVRHA